MLVDVSTANRNPNLLAPFFAAKVIKALEKCHRAGYQAEIFEGYRTPQRQGYLYAKGRSEPGPVVTHSEAWRSWHQYSVAVDIAFRVNGTWNWDGPWDWIDRYFAAEGLARLSFERAHWQLTGGLSLEMARTIVDDAGLPAVWHEIERKLNVQK